MEDQEDPDDLQSRVDAALEKGDIDRRDALDITRNLRNGEDEEKLMMVLLLRLKSTLTVTLLQVVYIVSQKIL
jgi:hypothetical protein